jgi:hypothetical protein
MWMNELKVLEEEYSTYKEERERLQSGAKKPVIKKKTKLLIK